MKLKILCLSFLMIAIPTKQYGRNAVIGLLKMNVLYIGVSNPVSFAVHNHNSQELELVTDNGRLVRTGINTYDAFPKEPGKTVLYVLDKKKDTLDRLTFRTKMIPDPVAKVHRKTGGYIGLPPFRAQAGVIATLENYDFDARFQVTSFDFLVIRDGEMMIDERNTGALFKGDVEGFITKKLKAGDKVFISKIKARGPDGRTRELNEISLTVN